MKQFQTSQDNLLPLEQLPPDRLCEQVRVLRELLSSETFQYLMADVEADCAALDAYIRDSRAELNDLPQHFRYIGELAQLERFRPIFETHIEMCLAALDTLKQQPQE